MLPVAGIGARAAGSGSDGRETRGWSLQRSRDIGIRPFRGRPKDRKALIDESCAYELLRGAPLELQRLRGRSLVGRGNIERSPTRPRGPRLQARRRGSRAMRGARSGPPESGQFQREQKQPRCPFEGEVSAAFAVRPVTA